MPNTATLEIILQSKDLASKNLKGVKGNLAAVGKVAAGLAGAAVAGTAALAAGIGKLAVDARAIPGIQGAFEGLTQTFEGGSKAMLAALQQASSGMVTNVDLMKQYNLAAQLVGENFAQELPEAMQYLSKVAAATGEDMGFMMDSLIRGVGRMSPMILDNLGIQVSLAEATERAAEMFGKEASELSKSEQQAGMMNVVMEKLRTNTADMPEVVGSAAQQWQSLGVTFNNLKDRIGTAFLPVLQELMETIGPMLADAIEAAMPYIQDFASLLSDKLPGALESLITNVQTFINVLKRWEPVIVAVVAALGTFIIITTVVGWISGLVTAITGAIATISAASSVLAGIVAVLGGPVTVAIIAITAVVAAFALAWKTNFLGIRDVTKSVLDWIREAIQNVTEFMQLTWAEKLEAIKEIAVQIWGNIKSAISTKLQEIRTVISTWLANIRTVVSNYASSLLQAGKDLIQGLLNGIKAKWQDVKGFISNLASQLPEWFKNLWGIGSPSKVMMEIGRDLLAGLIVGLDEKIPDVLGKIEEVVEAVTDAFSALLELAQTISGAGELTTTELSKFKIMAWATWWITFIDDLVWVLGWIANEAMKQIEDYAVDAINAISDATDAVGDLTESLFGFSEILGAMDKWQTTELSKSQIQSWATWWITFVDDLVWVLGWIASQAMTQITDKGVEAMQKIAEATNTLGDLLNSLSAFSDALAVLSTDIPDVPGLWKIIAWVKQVADEVWKLLAAILLVEFPKMEEDMRKIIEQMTASMSTLADLAGAIDKFIGAIGKLGAEIPETPGLWELIAWMKDVKEQFTKVLVAIMVTVFPKIEEDTRKIIEEISGAISAVSDLLSSLVDFVDVLREIKTLVVVDITKEEAKRILSELIDWVEYLHTELGRLAEEALENFKQSASDAIEQLSDVIEQLGNISGKLVEIKDFLVDLEEFPTINIAQLEMNLERIRDGIDLIIEHFQDLDSGGAVEGTASAIQAVKDAISELVEEIERFGELTVQPLIDSLDELQRVAVNVINAISDAWKSALGGMVGAIDDAIEAVHDIIDALESIPTDITTTVHVEVDDPSGLLGTDDGGLSVAGAGGGGSLTVTVPVNIDGREVGRATARITADELRLQGLVP